MKLNEIKLTSSLTMYCTVKGATIPQMFENPFVNPIKAPEKFGDKSKWFTLNPQKIAEFIPTAMTSNVTALVCSSSSVLPRNTRAIAGMIRPKKEVEINCIYKKERIDMTEPFKDLQGKAFKN